MRKTRHNYTPLIEYKLFPESLNWQFLLNPLIIKKRKH